MEDKNERFLKAIRNNKNFVMLGYVDGYVIGKSLGFNDIEIANRIRDLESGGYIEIFTSPRFPGGGYINKPKDFPGDNLVKITEKGIDFLDKKDTIFYNTKNVIKDNIFHGNSSINQNIDSHKIVSIQLQKFDFIFILDLIVKQLITSYSFSNEETKEISDSYKEFKEALNNNVEVNDKKNKFISTMKRIKDTIKDNSYIVSTTNALISLLTQLQV